MTTAQVAETSVTATNSSFQNYAHPDDLTRQTTDTPGFKPFTTFTKLSQYSATDITRGRLEEKQCKVHTIPIQILFLAA